MCKMYGLRLLEASRTSLHFQAMRTFFAVIYIPIVFCENARSLTLVILLIDNFQENFVLNIKHDLPLQPYGSKDPS